MWGGNAFDNLQESNAPQHMSQVVETLRTTAEASNAANVVVFVKEALTSKHFAHNARSFSFIREQVKSNAQLYTNLQEPFNTTAFSALFQNVQVYTIQSVDELSALVAQLTADLTASTQAQNVVLVVIKESVDNSNLDTIVE
jgi:hypothetical protein